MTETGARDQPKGRVKSLKLGAVMAEVAVDVAGQEIVAAITCTSPERPKLKQGAPVTAIIKATEVMIAKQAVPIALRPIRWSGLRAGASAAEVPGFACEV